MLPLDAEKAVEVVTHCHARRTPKKAADPIRYAVKVGNVSVPIYAMPYVRKNGTTGQQYCVSFYEAGRRMRRNFAALSEAKGFAEKQARAIERGEREAVRITGDDARTFGLARTILTGTSLTIVEVCRQFVTATKRLPADVTLIQAVEDFAARVSRVEQKTVAEAASEFIASRRDDGCSARYVKTIQSYLASGVGKKLRARNTFGSVFGAALIDSIKTAAIEQWLGQRAPGRRNRRNMLLLIRTFFNFARSKGYLPKNQPTAADEIPLPRVPVANEIPIFSTDDMAKMLHGTPERKPKAESILWLGLGGFAGLRTAEILRLEWSDIQMATGYIVVRARHAKTGRRRIIPIQPNLAKWLRPLAKPAGPLFERNRPEERTHDYAKSIGVKWQPNGLRHSFISYRVAQTQDLAKVSLEAGNSPAICERNYRELVTAEDAVKWFAIAPAVEP